jgi:hypothetical protein
MKYEMTVADRKRRRRGPPTLEERMEELDVPAADREEVRKFAAFLADGGLPLAEQIDKHGAEYLGFTPEEVAAINGAAR